MLRLYAFFHLNLMFSSIEEHQRGEIIARCYWPILRLARRLKLPIGIEASGFTLETIAALDPSWLAEARALIEAGLIEPIGSGYTQMIGPLMPADLVEWNLKLGHQAYERLWGARPRLALINEQAYSAGILPHYEKAGYDAVIMDWDICAHAHPEWPDEWRYNVQLAQGAGAALPVLWTSTLLFQQLQRLAHGDLEFEDYVAFVRARAGPQARTLALYSNDAECFDYRPGRFKTEAALAKTSEWTRIETAFASLARSPEASWIAPTLALASGAEAHSRNPVQLETADYPIPVKKQLKYNASRWAVTGRASFELNARCRAAARTLREVAPEDETLWRDLCWLASSDLRTHITETRFREGLDKLARLEDEIAALRAPPVSAPSSPGLIDVRMGPRMIELVGERMSVAINPRKGLALDRLAIGPPGAAHALIGTVPYGTYDDLVHAFDWYSGTLIAEMAGHPKITDLAAVTPEFTRDDAGVQMTASFETPLGAIRKTLNFDGESLACRYELDWPAPEKFLLRIANLTLLPGEVDAASLYYETHNGGVAPERFALHGQTLDHGAPVSLQVSACAGAGMSEGTLTFGDAAGALRLSADRGSDGFLALVTHRLVKGRVFARIALSASELDDTRRPWHAARRPLALGYRISPA
jgi:hypothetical protein